MNNSIQRLLTASVAVPLMYVIFYVGGLLYLLFFLILIVVGQLEYQKLLESKNLPNEKTLGVISSALFGIGAYAGYYYLTLCFTAFVILVLILGLRKSDLNKAIVSIGTTVFGVIYVGWLLSHGILLRNVVYQNENVRAFAEKNQGVEDFGFFFVLFAVACTFLNDTGAYYTGKLFGKRKLSAKISPGKTVEGTLGGIVICVVTALVVNALFSSPLNPGWTVAFGLIISITAVFGDLVESLLKRSVGMKDSGGIVPGHGGVLDRFDSLILVFPVFYYLVLGYYKLQLIL